MRVGFFREMPHGDAAGPSLAEARRDAPEPDEQKIAAYLEHGHVRVATPGLTHDVFDPGKMIGAPHLLTDGRFEWPGDLAYYVRTYHILLPAPFIEHMGANAWQVPAEVDVTVPLPLEGVRCTDIRWLTGEGEFSRGWITEVAHRELARSLLPQMPVYRRLIAASDAGPMLWDEVRKSFGYSPDVWQVMEHLRDRFPPVEPIPTVVPSFPPELGTAIQRLAEGEPGEPVSCVFPSRVTKLARLLLARAAVYPADRVLHAAEHAYDRDRSSDNRSYHAHDAFACALVHPRIDAIELAEWYARQPQDHRGSRSRRKTNRLLAWARFHGYLPDPSGCPCGHHRFTAPRTRRTVMALARHGNKISHLLEVIERDDSRWLGVYRCTLCAGIWAEDDITSGHAEMFFYYPIKTGDPKAWLSRAEPLQPGIRSW